MLQHSLPKKTNIELQKLLDSGDKETIILCHLRLASSLAKKLGRDDEYFDAAIFGLVLGVERLKDLPHDNITGYLVHWMNQHIRKVTHPSTPIEYDPECGGQSEVDLNDQLSSLSDLDQAIISMKRSGFTNEEVCKHLETTQWYIQKAKSHLKRVLAT